MKQELSDRYPPLLKVLETELELQCHMKLHERQHTEDTAAKTHRMHRSC